MATRIRRAAVACFAYQGYRGTGIRDIAREAGLTTASLYHYMDSKESLLVDIMCEGQDKLNQLTSTALTSYSAAEEKLAVLVNGLVGTHAINPHSTRVIDSEIRSLSWDSHGRAHIIELRDQYEAMWSHVIDRGSREQVFEIDDPHVMRLGLITMCTGTSNWYRKAAQDDPYALASKFVDIALGSVRAKRHGEELHSSNVPGLDIAMVPSMEFEPR